MALNVNRWVNYAKTRLESAVGRGNDELTRLESEREAELADKPWLRSDGEAPTLEEARARIEWEARRQQEVAASHDTDDHRPSAETADGSETEHADGSDASDGAAADPSGVPTPPADPEALRLSAEAAQAKLAIEARDRAAAERLAEIRRELGVDTSPDDTPPGERPNG